MVPDLARASSLHHIMVDGIIAGAGEEEITGQDRRPKTRKKSGSLFNNNSLYREPT